MRYGMPTKAKETNWLLLPGCGEQEVIPLLHAAHFQYKPVIGVLSRMHEMTLARSLIDSGPKSLLPEGISELGKYSLIRIKSDMVA